MHQKPLLESDSCESHEALHSDIDSTIPLTHCMHIIRRSIELATYTEETMAEHYTMKFVNSTDTQFFFGVYPQSPSLKRQVRGVFPLHRSTGTWFMAWQLPLLTLIMGHTQASRSRMLTLVQNTRWCWCRQHRECKLRSNHSHQQNPAEWILALPWATTWWQHQRLVVEKTPTLKFTRLTMSQLFCNINEG